MDRINGADTVDIGSGRRGFIDEDLGVGQVGTEVTALWLNMTQEEIIKVIEGAGLVLNPADWTQLWQALRILGFSSSNRRWTAVNSMTLSSAPGAPALGDTYLIPAGATGIWSAQIGKIAEWNGQSWSYVTPPDGHGISLADGRVFERVSGVYIEKLALDQQSGKWTYAVVGGTANALTATLAPAPAALTVGMTVRLLINLANTGAMTLNLNALGAIPIVLHDGTPVQSGQFAAGQVATFAYDGTSWRWQPQWRPATQAEMDAGTSDRVFATPATIKDQAVVLFYAGHSAAQSIPNDLITAFNNLTLSENSLLDSTFASAALTIGPKDAGLWLLLADFAATIPGTSNIQYAEIYVNGVRRLAGGGPSNTNFSSTPQAIGFTRLNAGDVVRLFVRQVSGAARNSNIASLSGFRLGK